MTIKNKTTNNTRMTSQRGNNVGCLSCRSEHLQYCFNTSTTLQNSVAWFVSDSWASCYSWFYYSLNWSDCRVISKADACRIDALDQWRLRMLLGIKWYQFVRNSDVWRLMKQPKLTAIGIIWLSSQHHPTGSETSPPYTPQSSRFGSEPPSVEDYVEVWYYKGTSFGLQGGYAINH